MTLRTTFLSTVALAGLSASAVSAEGGLAQGVGLAGSDRLVLFALLQPGDEASLAAAQDLAHRMGQGSDTPEVIRQDVSVSPILSWDDNINGGYANDSFVAGGLTWGVREEEQAVAGLLTGASVDAAARVALGGRNALDLSAQVWGAYAPTEDLWTGGAVAQACLSHRLNPANHLKGCLLGSHEAFELGQTSRVIASGEYARLFASGFGLHEASLTIADAWTAGDDGDAHKQTAATLRLINTHHAGVSTLARLTLGEEVEGHHVTTRGFELGAAAILRGRPTALSVSWSESEGGVFLGEAREADTWTVSLARPLNDHITLRASYSRTDSNVDFYDDEGIGFSVDMSF